MRFDGHDKCGFLLLAFLALCVGVVAHGELSSEELKQYHHNIRRDGEALSRCLQSPEMRGHNARMMVHRDQTLRHMRKARGVDIENGMLAFDTLILP
jgi:hypothetical protein